MKENNKKLKDEELKEVMNNAQVKIEKSVIDKEDRSEKFVRAIPEALLNEYKDRKKAYITTQNEKGILKARAINKFCFLNFGFENEVLNSLEQKKIEISLSVKGRGIDKVIDFGKAFGYTVMSNEDETKGIMGGVIRKR